ncbi:YicC family protein [Pseudothioclava arenosa]|uniref:YicC family protein n=2 Tax=Pseudothioclava arenosa TaxID=1795308 RepID=A0A2A4CRV7_9RHOB|nr:YicC family protein [Pseudothioclava arenosa]
MTGFAAGQGSGAGHDWSWDIRSVNGKTFDLRLRLPELEGLEQGLRKAVAEVARRGNISLSLKLARSQGDEAMRLSGPGLEAALAALGQVRRAAEAQGMALAEPTPVDILTLRGVIDQSAPEIADPAELVGLILADLGAGLAAFAQMRAGEGAEIGAVVAAQLARIAELTETAAEQAEARRPEAAAALNAALARVMEGAPGADPARIAQELAMLAVKADVTEELDRLRAHIKAARALLADDGPVGRKFEFLTQEFVREANTLCSKAGNAALTATGLELKHVIDQMREQIMNVE